jgi:hypothetical protein
MVLGRMKQALRFLLGLALTLIFAAATISAVVLTFVTVKDAVLSGGSLVAFEARLRHYSDRLVADKDGFRLMRAPHPFALHFGVLAISWVMTVACATALRYLQRTDGGGNRTRSRASHHS